jgi:predicted ATPase
MPLATSRVALMADGEEIWPVPSPGFRDGSRSPAVELIVEPAVPWRRVSSATPHRTGT